MEPPSGFGMGLASISSTPGPGPFASSAGGFGAFGQQFGGPASTYAPPSGLGAASGPYPPMGQMNQMNQMNAPYGSGNASHSAASFGNPATQAAFTGADHVPQPVGASNGNFYGNDASADPFAFLSTGLGALGVDDSRRNGASNNKSPA
ncbi:asparagine-rich protein [Histoplasma capsulatum G186AR]|nr:asparagine-rich protein [Histoplasma capsulatum]QSS76353.1 asparagine-rich protein [Histoplasma capsulatum G186AR]